MLLARRASPPRAALLRFVSSGPAFDWLSDNASLTGDSAKRVVAELTKTGMKQEELPQLFDQMGEAGIKSLIRSVERTRAARANKDSPIVELIVEVPKEKRNFTIRGHEGETLYEIVTDAAAETGGQELARYLECACGGVMACSTCHVLLEPTQFKEMSEPCEAELDMLDLAYGYEENSSRLGCQLKLKEAFNGARIRLPSGVYNFF